MKTCAEYLPRIQRVSLAVEGVIAPHASEVVAKGRVARLGDLELPLPVDVPSQTVKVVPEAPSFSVRFQAPPTTKQLSPDGPLNHRDLAVVESTLCCAECGSPALKNLPIQWKQLPSEHWAELMDLWHCHKPSTTTTTTTNPVYQTGFQASPGIAFVSDAYLLVHEYNLAGCPHINAPKLWKWDLSSDVRPEAFIAAILRETIDAHGIYTFDFGDVVVWVFGLGTQFCTADFAGEGFKVFWTTDKQLGQKRPEIEPIELPPRGISVLRTALETSTASLPAEAATFGAWNIAFLSIS